MTAARKERTPPKAPERYTICRSTAFSSDQCLGCGTLIKNIPAHIPSVWDAEFQPEWSPLRNGGR